MKLLVVGCKLQGTEAIYLAKQAGFFVTAVDHRADACGSGLADRFVQADVYDEEIMLPLFRENDAVLPVIEDLEVCRTLERYGRQTETPVIFDTAAYAVSSSKRRSNALFRQLGLPLPESYPVCGFPVILKPDDQSGSAAVQRAESQAEVDTYLARANGNVVIQQYLEGRSFSLEVLSMNGEICCPMITEVCMDSSYDCSRIVAPAKVTAYEAQQLYKIAEKLAAALHMNGIFDIEVISHHGKLKLLEIDARLPSQTPIAVYHASGFNMVEWLVRHGVGQSYDVQPVPKQICWYQQIQVSPSAIRVLGEHIMSDCPPLRHMTGFFGAEEAMTDFTSDCGGRFRAIVILYGKTTEEVRQKMQRVLRRIQKEYSIPRIEDAYLTETCKQTERKYYHVKIDPNRHFAYSNLHAGV